MDNERISYYANRPREFKEDLIVALKSGDYRKGKRQLYRLNRDGDARFCCLGVAAVELLGFDPKYLNPGNNTKTAGMISKAYDAVRSCLRGSGMTHKLIDLNDSQDSWSGVIECLEQGEAK